VGIRCADHVTPSTRKSRHYFADSGGRSVGIVRLRTKATERKRELDGTKRILKDNIKTDVKETECETLD
jgi:hypothetical protein